MKHTFTMCNVHAFSLGASAGMDPGARRLMWEAILRATQPGPATGPLGIAMVLTTHYMEECEALCERVGIMNKVRDS